MKNASIYLRAFEPEDYRKIAEWRRDEEVYELTTGNRHFVSSETDRKWVLDKIANNQTEIYLAICLAVDDSLIGYVGLSEIDHRNRRAEWSAIVIGEKEYRGQGYATEAAYLLLEFAFDELGLHRVSGSWLAENTVSMFLGRMIGFRQEGVLRQHVYRKGCRHDVVIMSMLRPEFERWKESYLE
jgi:RimJ/RimL family protein N-acetyltransferase